MIREGITAGVIPAASLASSPVKREEGAGSLPRHQASTLRRRRGGPLLLLLLLLARRPDPDRVVSKSQADDRLFEQRPHPARQGDLVGGRERDEHQDCDGQHGEGAEDGFLGRGVPPVGGDFSRYGRSLTQCELVRTIWRGKPIGLPAAVPV